MAQASKYIGISPITGQSLGGDANLAITSAGTTRATAKALTNTINMITTNAATTPYPGVSLPTGSIGDEIYVYNATVNPLNVYPNSATAQINQIAAGGPHILAPYSSCSYVIGSASQIIGMLSA